MDGEALYQLISGIHTPGLFEMNVSSPPGLSVNTSIRTIMMGAS